METRKWKVDYRLARPHFQFAERIPLNFFAIPNPFISLTQATGRATRYLVSQLSKLALGLSINSRRLLGLGQLAASSLLALVVCAALNLSPLLESVISCQPSKSHHPCPSL